MPKGKCMKPRIQGMYGFKVNGCASALPLSLPDQLSPIAVGRRGRHGANDPGGGKSPEVGWTGRLGRSAWGQPGAQARWARTHAAEVAAKPEIESISWTKRRNARRGADARVLTQLEKGFAHGNGENNTEMLGWNRSAAERTGSFQ